jgi:hypothetical protein
MKDLHKAEEALGMILVVLFGVWLAAILGAVVAAGKFYFNP